MPDYRDSDVQVCRYCGGLGWLTHSIEHVDSCYIVTGIYQRPKGKSCQTNISAQPASTTAACTWLETDNAL
jgi:hypothetical protein